jgi:hypothetical protein
MGDPDVNQVFFQPNTMFGFHLEMQKNSREVFAKQLGFFTALHGFHHDDSHILLVGRRIALYKLNEEFFATLKETIVEIRKYDIETYGGHGGCRNGNMNRCGWGCR